MAIKPILRRVWGWGPAIVVMALIFYFSSKPAPEIIRTKYIFSQDKFLHIFAYFFLAALFLRGFIWEGKSWTRNVVWTAVGLSAFYGLTDELHQAFVPERTAGWDDWVADAIGAGLVYLVRGPLGRLFEKERRAAGRGVA